MAWVISLILSHILKYTDNFELVKRQYSKSSFVSVHQLKTILLAQVHTTYDKQLPAVASIRGSMFMVCKEKANNLLDSQCHKDLSLMYWDSPVINVTDLKSWSGISVKAHALTPTPLHQLKICQDQKLQKQWQHEEGGRTGHCTNPGSLFQSYVSECYPQGHILSSHEVINTEKVRN